LRIAVGDSRNTEIQYLRLASFVDQYVARLEIPMNDASLMRVVHRFGDFHHDLQAFAGVQMACFGMVTR
jgi:hypothetical protein